MERASAQIQYRDPVVYDWPKIKSTLVLGGALDTPISKYIGDTIPGGKLVLLPGLGHVRHFEAPETFNKELLKLLKG